MARHPSRARAAREHTGESRGGLRTLPERSAPSGASAVLHGRHAPPLLHALADALHGSLHGGSLLRPGAGGAGSREDDRRPDPQADRARQELGHRHLHVDRGAGLRLLLPPGDLRALLVALHAQDRGCLLGRGHRHPLPSRPVLGQEPAVLRGSPQRVRDPGARQRHGHLRRQADPRRPPLPEGRRARGEPRPGRAAGGGGLLPEAHRRGRRRRRLHPGKRLQRASQREGGELPGHDRDGNGPRRVRG